MDNLELDRQLRELRQLRRMAEELQAQITQAEDAVKAELTTRDTDQIITDQYKVTWKPVTSTRLDAKALKAELPDIYARYARESVSKRFLVV